MNKRLKYAIIIILLAFAAVNGYKSVRSGVKTEMAYHGELEKSFTLDAVVIRDETPVTAKHNGVLESMVPENTMVARGKYIAGVYGEQVDENIKKKFVRVNERINEITNNQTETESVYNDSYRTESLIDEAVQNMIDISPQRDVNKIVEINDKIGILHDKKTALSGNTDELLSKLYAEKSEYESKLGKSRENIYAPAAGVYGTNIDGYESIVTPDAVGNMTPDDFDAIKDRKITKQDIEESNVICKITDFFEWSVAVIVTDEQLSELKQGSTVYLRNTGSGEDAEAVVSYISNPKNGRYVLIATSDIECDWAMTERFVRLDIVKNRYSGLKIPVSAIRVSDNVTGVYVKTEGTVKFKPVEVYYKSGKYAIVKEDNSSGNGLLLYDEVVTSSDKRIKPGMRIK